MMKRVPQLYLTICLLLMAASARASLPEPPKQHEPWTPPAAAGLPEYVVKVAATLFDAGLADPRGGAYREVEIEAKRGSEDTIQTHAWVFAGGFAVCWNGLVYNVKSTGSESDLDRDVRTITAAHPWRNRIPLPKSEPNPPKAAFWYDMELGEMLPPTSISLLLRLGRADLAAMLWQTPEESIPGLGVIKHEEEDGLWLSTAAMNWFGTAYWRLLRAVGNDDDKEAVTVAESILQWRSRVPDAWRKANKWFPKRVPDISFLDPVPALLADSERRMSEAARPKIDLRVIADGKGDPTGFLQKPQTERIAVLVQRLEDVQGGKISIPGALIYSFDPVYRLLKKEGEAAVDSLLNAYENDQRLTRTFDYSRPWNIEYTPITVHHVLELLLVDILGDPDLIHRSTPAELRAWWRQHQSSDRVTRSFEALADDHAPPQRWLESATYLTARSDVEVDGSRISGSKCDPQKPAPALYGESLRSRQGPSLAELLAKRTAALAATNSDLACGMAVTAALWDLKSALPVLRTAVQLKSCRGNPLMAMARLSLGDSGGGADWAAALPHHPKFPPLMVADLAPLWMFPDEPALRPAADWLFGRPDSAWSPANGYNYANGPLLAVPLYRRAVMSALADSKIAGTATRSGEGSLSLELLDRDGGGTNEPSHDPRQAPPGEQRPVRIKDLVAWEISDLDGAPEFAPDWPEADKDAAIPQIINFLNEHQGELQAFPARLQDAACLGAELLLKGTSAVH